MVRFLAEIAKRREVKIHPSPYDAKHGIYRLDMGPPPEESYWKAWGGSYGHYTESHIEIFYRQFLRHVESMEDLRDDGVNNAIFIDKEERAAYIKVPMHPWLYPDYGTDVNELVPFISAPLNPLKPYANELPGAAAKTGLEKPSFNVRLSEGVSGISLNQSFKLSFANNGGFFDDESAWNMFNAPAYLKKAVKENPQYEDFKKVREGLVDSTAASLGTFAVEVSDKFRAMNMPACGMLGAEYKGIAVCEAAAGKNIPIVYGKKKVKLLDLDGNGSCLAAEHVSKVHCVYGKEGSPMPWKLENGIIKFDYLVVLDIGIGAGVFGKNDAQLSFTVNENFIQVNKEGGKYPAVERVKAFMPLEMIGLQGPFMIIEKALFTVPHRYDSDTGMLRFAEADQALISGYAAEENGIAENSIGSIIKSLVSEKGGVAYVGSYWNLAETGACIKESPKINIVFDGGDVKKAVQDVLKSGMAYLIQQADGKFTLRQWGKTYKTHAIEPWTISGAPEKQYDAASERYFSSCSVKYESGDWETKAAYLFKGMERQAEKKYRKRKTAEFETDLAEKKDAAALAKLLGSRYSEMRQTLTVPLGIDTSEMELLDTVILEMKINGREFSAAKKFVITGIDPAQDILTLEEAEDGWPK